VGEARDLGDVDRFQFYDHMKTYTAAPPDVLRVDEKHLREHYDRRHFVAWCDLTKEDFTPGYGAGTSPAVITTSAPISPTSIFHPLIQKRRRQRPRHSGTSWTQTA
jgi:hypothetical protein